MFLVHPVFNCLYNAMSPISSGLLIMFVFSGQKAVIVPLQSSFRLLLKVNTVECHCENNIWVLILLCLIYHNEVFLVLLLIISPEMFEDTRGHQKSNKGIMGKTTNNDLWRYQKSNKGIMGKTTNNDLQTTTQKSNVWATRTLEISGVNSYAPKWYVVSASLVGGTRCVTLVKQLSDKSLMREGWDCKKIYVKRRNIFFTAWVNCFPFLMPPPRGVETLVYSYPSVHHVFGFRLMT